MSKKRGAYKVKKKNEVLMDRLYKKVGQVKKDKDNANT